MTIDGLPLRCGASGDAVRDVQRRLAAAGLPVDDEAGTYAEGTEAAVRSFQQVRGLVVDGVCGRDTWAALVEAGYALGDRLLYLRTPMLRGDDVAALQRKLGALGFDAGRVDGIFGPATERALKDFQRNSGITVDGVGGPDVLTCLTRLGGSPDAAASVAGVREREQLRHAPRHLADRRVVVGETGGLEALATTTGRALHDQGALVAVLHDPDPSAQAAEANGFDADLYLGVAISPDRTPRIAYYATTGFESAGGRHLADLLAIAVAAPLGTGEVEVVGLRATILRETRMPAVVCHLGPPEVVVAHLAELAAAMAGAVGRWVDTPLPA